MPAKKKAKVKEEAKASESEFDSAMAAINKERGNVVVKATTLPQANHIPTGAFMMDFALLGGIPEGYATMFYGYESCVHKDTKIHYQVRDHSDKLVNSKGGTIETLYRRFNGLNKGKHGDHLARRDVIYYVMSVDEDGGVFRNGIVDVVKTGSKPVYELTTGGGTIRATMQHKFLTPNGFKPLSELSVGDEVMMHLTTGRGRVPTVTRPTIHVHNHPRWPLHDVHDSKTGKTYTYHRGPLTHAIYEAHMNGLPFEDYVSLLNGSKEEWKGGKRHLWFMSEGNHIHHEDGNYMNNDPANLTMLTPQEHGLRHADDCSENTKYIATPETVIGISYCEQVPTYDIKCAYPYNNYIAEKFVVHNSGKTMISKKTVAGFHAKHPDKQAVWVDAEGMFDKDWAQTLGCDLERLHVARPTTGNEGVDMIEALMEPKEVGLIVLDSIPGFVPQRIAEKSAEDPTMGELARLMGIMCSKIYLAWARERRRNHWVTIILINQFRMKIGLTFGDPRTLPGGRQINHLPTTKIELKNNEIAGKDSFDSQAMVRNEHSFRITKAKHGRSVREGEFHMSLSEDANEGIGTFEFINHKAVITYAKRFGILNGGGGKYTLDTIPDETFRTYDDLGTYLISNPKAMLKAQQTLIAMQREDKGLTAYPEDGYLLAPAASKRIVRRG